MYTKKTRWNIGMNVNGQRFFPVVCSVTIRVNTEVAMTQTWVYQRYIPCVTDGSPVTLKETFLVFPYTCLTLRKILHMRM